MNQNKKCFNIPSLHYVINGTLVNNNNNNNRFFQAEKLDVMLSKRAQPLDSVVEFAIDDNLLVSRNKINSNLVEINLILRL